MTGAIENHVTNPDRRWDCQTPGSTPGCAGALIHYWHSFGDVPARPRRAGEYCSDVGLNQKIALNLGAPGVPRTRTSLQHPELSSSPESDRREKIAGCCVRWKIGRPVRSVQWPSGQEVSVTPVRAFQRFRPIANGCTLHRLHIVQEIRGDAPVALSAAA